MERSRKLGLVSAGLCAVPFLAGDSSLSGPIDLTAFVTACVLGLLAARDGSKWWLLAPGLLAGGTLLVLAVTWNAR